jgi:hypothetical protein
MVKFESGKAEIADAWSGELLKFDQWSQLFDLMKKGMMADRDFIDIEAGTSGTGDTARNRDVMDARVDEAMDLILKELSRFKVGKLGFAESAILNKIRNVKREYSTIEPGSVLPGGLQVPTDADDPYFEDFQYVQICVNPVPTTPAYDSIAEDFMNATIRNNMGYNEETVYSVLGQLRDADDFKEFNDELKRSYGMDFYEISCDKISADLSPGWFDYIIGRDPDKEVTFATEIGPGDETINVHLQRLGVQPINCY